MPQKFRHGKPRRDSAQSVAVTHATLDAVSSSSERDRACMLVAANRYQQHTGHQHSADSDMSVELRWTKVAESSGQITAAEVGR